jgi:hypothetical protein
MNSEFLDALVAVLEAAQDSCDEGFAGGDRAARLNAAIALVKDYVQSLSPVSGV